MCPKCKRYGEQSIGSKPVRHVDDDDDSLVVVDMGCPHCRQLCQVEYQNSSVREADGKERKGLGSPELQVYLRL
jgi:phage FluMu protein Com